MDILNNKLYHYAQLSIQNYHTRFFSFFVISFSTSADAQSWTQVGHLDSVTHFVDEMDMALSPAGVPYVIYSDGNFAYQATVMAYIAGSWVAVGDTDFTSDAARNPSIAIDGSGTPYVVFNSFSLQASGYRNDSIVTVMKYNGSGWVVAGTGTFYPAVLTGGHRSIALDPSGVPYIIYQDPTNGAKITVRKWTGTAWQAVGGPGFSSANISAANIMIGSDGVPYVAYLDSASNVVVQQYNGINWVNVGSDPSGIGTASALSANISHDGMPYVLLGNGWKMQVKGYNGTDWEYLDTATLPAGTFGDIAIDGSGIPYIGFADSAHTYARVMKYSGGHWTNVGNSDFSNAGITYTSMAIDSSGMPYIGFEKDVFFTANVMNLSEAAAVSNISATDQAVLNVYPNPNNGSFAVELKYAGLGHFPITVTNCLGEKVAAFSIPANTAIPTHLQVPPGIYFLTAEAGMDQMCVRVAVE